MRKTGRNITALALVFLALSLVFAGCAGESKKEQPVKPIESLEDVFLTVRLPEAKTKRFLREEIEKLPEVTLSVDGKILVGPSLETVLKASGVESFSAVTVDGEGGSVDLSKDESQAGVMLDLSNPENLTLVIPDVPKARTLTSVTTIKVE